MSRLALADADRIADRASIEGHERGFAPLCVVVLDAGGHALVVQRDERASIGRVEIVTGKEHGCLVMGFGGRALAQRAAQVPQFFAALATVLPKGIVPVADGDLVGAIGISGDTSDNDEIPGLVADTAAPPA